MADYDYQGYIQIFIIWLISTILIRAILTRKRSKAQKSPPGPLALPIIGHLHLLAPVPHQALHKLSARYGPIMQLHLGSVPCVVASTPEAAREFLKTHETRFSNRPRNFAVEYLTYGSQDFTFAPYGPYWKFMKRLCMSELLGGHTLNQLSHVRREETVRFLGVLFKRGDSGVDVGAELMTLSNNVISRMIMNKTHDGEAEEGRRFVQDTSELSGKVNVSDFVWFLKNWDLQGFGKTVREIRDRFDAMMERAIEEHEEERRRRKREEAGGRGDDGKVKDLLDILLDIHEDESSEFKLTKENIKAFILNVFIAGTDTSALTIQWALAELINHPQVMERARQEISVVVGNSRIVEESDLVNLPYLQAIVKETLRVHPTAPMIPRESSESCTVLGYEIPANTMLLVNLWAIGRDPNYWDNPLEFRPERFLGEEGSRKSQVDVRGQHFHLIPFGSGRRGCPGTSLALHVVQVNLAAMIQCFEWKVIGCNEIVVMEEKPGVALSRAHPLICVPMPRLNPFPSM